MRPLVFALAAAGMALGTSAGSRAATDVRPGDSTDRISPGCCVDVAEAFRIKNGMIRKVEALMTSLPYGVGSPFVPGRP